MSRSNPFWKHFTDMTPLHRRVSINSEDHGRFQSETWLPVLEEGNRDAGFSQTGFREAGFSPKLRFANTVSNIDGTSTLCHNKSVFTMLQALDQKAISIKREGHSPPPTQTFPTPPPGLSLTFSLLMGSNTSRPLK